MDLITAVIVQCRSPRDTNEYCASGRNFLREVYYLVFDVLHAFILGGLEIAKWVTWPDYALFRDGLSSVGLDLLWSTYTPNLRSLIFTHTTIRQAMQNV